MDVRKLKHQLYWVGAKDPDLRNFDITMETPHGTTYNAYLIRGSEKTALIETVKDSFFDTYLENIRNMTDLDNIDYLILNHTEPDHAGALDKLLHLAPHLKVVGSATAIKFIRNMVSKSFEAVLVNSGDVLDLGGLYLEFISAPFLHWPDSMMTYCPEKQVLFSCDIFGAHYCFDGLLASELTELEHYETARFHYYQSIMKPFKEHLVSAIEKVAHRPLDLICPGHGPIIDSSVKETLDIQSHFASATPKTDLKSVLVAYVSAYGYTKLLSEHIVEGLKAVPNIEVVLVDLQFAQDDYLSELIEHSEGILVGSPTLNADAPAPIWHFMSLISPITHRNKLAGAFGSYGWSGESVAYLLERFKQLRLQNFGSLKAQFKPSESELMDAYQFGVKFAEQLVGEVPVIVTPPLPKRQLLIPSDGLIHRWRCVICGEIFEGTTPPDVCPGCAASTEQFEIADETPLKLTSISAATIVIVGNGAAGTAACEAIRKRSEDASIILLSEENELGYYRPMLSDYISDSHNANRFYLHPMTWFVEHYIDLRLNTSVRHIEPKNKSILTNQNETIYYDKLILATGSLSVVPPITDVHTAGVFTLRTKADADAIIQYAKNARQMVVVGGGILGLETAWEIKNIGLEVTVLEMMNRLLPKHLDLFASSLLEKSVLDAGINIVTSANLSAILQKEGRVYGVQLLDGRTIDCDMIVISAGVKPNNNFALSSGIKMNRGILVDTHMRTSLPDIFAAGDVAEFSGNIPGLWAIATEQGKIAGANAIGESLIYEPTPPTTVFNGAGTSVFSIGLIHDCERKHCDFVCEADASRRFYAKLYFDPEGIFVGGILIGDTKASLALLRGYKKKVKKADILPAVFVNP